MENMKRITIPVVILAMFALGIVSAGPAEALSCIPPPITYVVSCAGSECTDGFEIHRVHIGNVCETRVQVWDPRGNFEEVTTGLLGDAAQTSGIYEFNVEDECISWVLYQLAPNELEGPTDEWLEANGRTWQEFCRDKADLTLLSEDTSADSLAAIRKIWSDQEESELIGTTKKRTFGSFFLLLGAALLGFWPWLIRLRREKRHADISKLLLWMIPLQLFGILYLISDPFLEWSYYPGESAIGIVTLAILFNVSYLLIKRMRAKR